MRKIMRKIKIIKVPDLPAQIREKYLILFDQKENKFICWSIELKKIKAFNFSFLSEAVEYLLRQPR